MNSTSGGLTEEAILSMPWFRFLSYCDSIREKNETREDINYFNGSNNLAQAWNKNKEKWRKGKQVIN